MIHISSDKGPARLLVLSNLFENDHMHGSKVRNISTRSALESTNFSFDRKNIVAHVWSAPGATIQLLLWLRRNESSYGAIICQTPFLAPLVRVAAFTTPLIIELGECQTLHLSRLQRTLRNRVKSILWYLIEAIAARCATTFVAISQEEAKEWKRLFPFLGTKVRVVNHSVAWTAGSPKLNRDEVAKNIGVPSGNQILSFVGALSGKQNLAAVEWIIDYLAPKLSTSVIIVLCGEGTQRFQREGDSGAKVIGLGFTEDVDSVIAASDICIAPLAAGAGVKTKVLHYVAHSKRVVGTPYAFEGLHRSLGMLECDLEDFAHTITEVLEQKENQYEESKRREAQADWLEQYFGKQNVVQQWTEVIQDTLANKK